MKVVFG